MELGLLLTVLGVIVAALLNWTLGLLLILVGLVLLIVPYTRR